MEGLTFVCPSCGGKLDFDPNTKSVICTSCNNKYTPLEIIKSKEKIDSFENHIENDYYDKTDESIIFECEACGGEAIALNSFITTSCPFCGNNILLKKNVEGKYKPKYIIPFSLSEDKATELLFKKITNKVLLPNDILKQLKNPKVYGMYVPFFLYNGTVKFNVSYKTETYNSNTARGQDRFYLQKFKYSGAVKFRRFPIDGLKEADDKIMDSISDFKTESLKQFQTPYLSGFFSKRIDVPYKQLSLRAKDKIEKEIRQYYLEKYKNTGASDINVYNVHLTDMDATYTIFPYWFINLKHNNKKYQIILNDQSKQCYGNYPKSIFKTIMAILGIFILFSQVFFWILYFITKSIAASTIISSILALGISLITILVNNNKKPKANYKKCITDEDVVYFQKEDNTKGVNVYNPETNTSTYVATKSYDGKSLFDVKASIIEDLKVKNKNFRQTEVLLNKGAISKEDLEKKHNMYKKDVDKARETISDINLIILMSESEKIDTANLSEVDEEMKKTNDYTLKYIQNCKLAQLPVDFITDENKNHNKLFSIYENRKKEL